VKQSRHIAYILFIGEDKMETDKVNQFIYTCIKITIERLIKNRYIEQVQVFIYVHETKLYVWQVFYLSRG
jgi:hypothetical protein